MTDELLEKADALKRRREAIKGALKAVEERARRISGSTFYEAKMAMSQIEKLSDNDELSVNFSSQVCEFIEVNLQTRLKEVQEEYANL